MIFLQQHQHVAAPQKSQYSMLVTFYIVFILLFLFPLGGQAAENQPPSATSISVSTKEDTRKSIRLTGTDPERNKLTYAIVSQPTHGTVVLKGTSATYTPTANYFSLPGSPDSFTFKVNDALVDSAPATVSVVVQAVNDVPVAQGGSVSAVKNTTRDIPLSGSDVDLDALTYVPAKKSKKGGVVSLKGNNIVTYTPKKDYVGTDSFTFTVKDNKKGVSKAATINIAVNGSNAAPTANAGTAQTVEGGAVVTLNGSGQDQDGNVTLYTWSQVVGTPVVSLTGQNTSTASFTAPSVDVDTPLTFRLTVTDNNGATATGDVVVMIKPIPINAQLQGNAVSNSHFTTHRSISSA